MLSDFMNELGVDASYDGTTELKAPARKSIRSLILTPTRELAVQIMNHFEKINKYTKKYIKVEICGRFLLNGNFLDRSYHRRSFKRKASQNSEQMSSNLDCHTRKTVGYA